MTLQPSRNAQPRSAAKLGPLPVVRSGSNQSELEDRLRARIDRLFGHSLHIRHVDAGSCNACESEIKLLTSPYYDLHRLGMFFAPSPRHADVLLVTGPVTRAMEGPLRRTYEAMPDPRLVIAVGACACGGGVFGPSAYEYGNLAAVLPVDVFIPGCPPTPVALIYGLLLGLDRVEQRLRDGSWAALASTPGLDDTGTPGPNSAWEPGTPPSGEKPVAHSARP